MRSESPVSPPFYRKKADSLLLHYSNIADLGRPHLETTCTSTRCLPVTKYKIMARFDGKSLKGLIGGIVTKTDKNGKIIYQSKAEHVNQSKGTKVASGIFGQASALAKIIRANLSYITNENHDTGMVNRFNTPFRDIMRQSFDKTTQTYSFSEDSFDRLAGFEFNVNSLLINHLLVKPTMKLEGLEVKVNIPEINIATQLKFAGGTNFCTLIVGSTQVALHKRRVKQFEYQTIDITSSPNAVIPAQEFTFTAAEGCLVTVGIGLHFYSLYNNIKTVYNSTACSPANVIGAVVTPGTFVEPPQRVEGNTTYASPWSLAVNLKI